MDDRQPVISRALHQAKMLVHRAGFDVSRDTFKHRFVYQVLQHGIDTVLDIGANGGQFGTLLRQSKFTGQIHSVEPLRSAYNVLSATAAGDARWSVQRAAVSAEPGTLTMNVSSNSVSSSVLPMLDRHATAAPSAQYVTTEDVVATTVDEIVTTAGLEPERTLLKIDVQGYERAVPGTIRWRCGAAGPRTCAARPSTAAISSRRRNRLRRSRRSAECAPRCLSSRSTKARR